GDALLPLAEAIRSANEGTPADTQHAWLLDYDAALSGFDLQDSILPNPQRDFGRDVLNACHTGIACANVFDSDGSDSTDYGNSWLIKNLGDLSGYVPTSLNLAFFYDPQDLDDANERLSIDLYYDGSWHNNVWTGNTTNDGDTVTDSGDWLSASIPLASMATGITSWADVRVAFEGSRLLDISPSDTDEIMLDDVLVTGNLTSSPSGPTQTIFSDGFEDGFNHWDQNSSDWQIRQITDSNATGHLVVLFDWASSSAQGSSGWTEAAGDALFGMLIDLGLVDPQAQTAIADLHFIGHGTGAAVASETVERLAHYHVPVDQVTYLDPIDYLASPGDTLASSTSDQQISQLGQPAGYGAAVWDNVDFTDVYYQTRGLNGTNIPDNVVPTGRPIPGANNVFLTPTASYDANDPLGDHTWIATGYYASTIGNAGIAGYRYSAAESGQGIRPASNFYTLSDLGTWSNATSYSQFDQVLHSGNYYYARVANSGHSPTDPTYWTLLPGSSAAPQDHAHSPTSLVDRSTGLPNTIGLQQQYLEPTSIVSAAWSARWNPLDTVNGGVDRSGSVTDSNVARPIPGWSFYGGSGESVNVLVGGTNPALLLSSNQPVVTHNAFYVPPQAEVISLDLAVTTSSANDTLKVFLGDTELLEDTTVATIDLTQISVSAKHRFWIPAGLRNQTHVLRIVLGDGGDSAVNSATRVDNVSLSGYVYEVHAGDITLIDLSAVAGGSAFTGLAQGIVDGGPDRVQFAENMDTTGNTFAANGHFYFVPDLTVTGQTVNYRDEVNFSVTVDGVPKNIRIDVLPGYTKIDLGTRSVGANTTSSTADNETLDVFRVQQRLRYLNYRGTISPVIVDGIGGSSAFQQAVELFQAVTQPPAEETFSRDPAAQTGQLNPSDANEDRPETLQQLNNPNAPRWIDVTTMTPHPAIDYGQLGLGRWVTSRTWQALDALLAAHLMDHESNSLGQFATTDGPRVTSLSFYPDNTADPQTTGWGIVVDMSDPNIQPPNQAANLINTSQQDLLDDLEPKARRIFAEIKTVFDTVGPDEWDVVYIGDTGLFATGYGLLRQTLEAFGIRAEKKSGYDTKYEIVLQPHSTPIDAITKDAIVDAFEAIRDDLVPALLTQDNLEKILPLVQQSIADGLDLETAIDQIVDTITDYFQSNSEATLLELENALSSVSVVMGGLTLELLDVSVTRERFQDPDEVVIALTVHAQQVTDIPNLGDIPAFPQDVLNTLASGKPFVVDAVLPLAVRIPILETSLDPEDIKIEPGEFVIQASMFDISDYVGRVGSLLVDVENGISYLDGQVRLLMDDLDSFGQMSLADLIDPLLGNSIQT
ncbi:MAG: hypothetical protein KDA99_07535, partial [Planctomycetales bacterium]|nr:hypothetical protein [Planctomycetales bacterium]